jgi:hypothetical protein
MPLLMVKNLFSITEACAFSPRDDWVDALTPALRGRRDARAANDPRGAAAGTIVCPPRDTIALAGIRWEEVVPPLSYVVDNFDAKLV